MEKTVLTNSRLTTARQCPRKDYYRNELCMVRDTEYGYLRLGTAVHVGLEVWHTSGTVEDAMAAVAAAYTGEVDEYEYVGVQALVAGYCAHTEPLELTQAEVTFEMPLRNPDTGYPSRTWMLAGKLDGLTEQFVVEHKTTGQDIGSDADYWLRLRNDPQISLYVLAARHMGYNVSSVIYNVLRKPALRPKKLPLLDVDGFKIVLDYDEARVFLKNGKPRQSGGEGMELQTRLETPEEFETRLIAELTGNPEKYFQRREIPILDDHLEEFQRELWQQAKALSERRKRGHWFKNVGMFTCSYCEYADLCLQNVDVDPERPPVGYRLVEANRELREDNGNGSTTEKATVTTGASTT